jgi:hypothetical protein
LTEEETEKPVPFTEYEAPTGPWSGKIVIESGVTWNGEAAVAT